MKRYLFIAVALSGLLMQTEHGSAKSKDKGRHVVVLSMDGFRWDYTSRAHTPTLDSLRRVGAYAEIYPCFPSNTFPNHYSMTTGLHPDHHGIVNNTFTDRATGKMFRISDQEALYNEDFWRGEPIWNVVERNGMRAAVFMWVGNQLEIGGRKASVALPFTNEISYKQRADLVLQELHRPADSVARLVMWYLDDPDHMGHNPGPDSPATTAMVEHLDSLLTYFFREVRTSPVFDRTDFIVMSDHGMAALAPERSVNLYPLLDPARMRSVVHGNPLYLEPEPSYIDEAVEIINAQPHLKAWRREDIPAKYHYGTDTLRILPVVVLPETQWTAQYSEKPRLPSGGTHGFDPFDRDMSMIFYASGPDFRVDYAQQPFQNLNLHAIIAKLLEIDPAQPNDCDLKPLKKMFKKR